eukprot:CAMPEP_0175001908 /NCGR_PEP_ID=MMETSP0005-20121125/3397_1 /TAXON_ID=420556 /ORGANISM="Ochromonas sp., Strain CCMP1393" /LENGTH=59 /DNA_ID=CAMNT_0016256851 /DNA_START=406 /DNA_END=582 /DNA_ORIENTATION=+
MVPPAPAAGEEEGALGVPVEGRSISGIPAIPGITAGGAVGGATAYTSVDVRYCSSSRRA